MKPLLDIQSLSKAFDGTPVVNGLSLQLEARQTLSVLGKSGCGKTTLLKMIAGLLSPDSGTIHMNGQPLIGRPPQHRDTVYLYQDDLLFPHMTVRENISFGLRIKKLTRKSIDHAVAEMIRHLELDGLGDKMPAALSGGQRQRVSFGRAIITEPKLLLLDEPFGSLDTGTRKTMQALFKRLSEAYQTTSLFITHDLKEALLMGDQIATMDQGQLKIYPSKSDFVADRQTGAAAEIAFWTSLNHDNV